MYLINNTRIRPTPPDNSGIAVRTADPINGRTSWASASRQA
jgi:hypothetical protein